MRLSCFTDCQRLAKRNFESKVFQSKGISGASKRLKVFFEATERNDAIPIFHLNSGVAERLSQLPRICRWERRDLVDHLGAAVGLKPNDPWHAVDIAGEKCTIQGGIEGDSILFGLRYQGGRIWGMTYLGEGRGRKLCWEKMIAAAHQVLGIRVGKSNMPDGPWCVVLRPWWVRASPTPDDPIYSFVRHASWSWIMGPEDQARRLWRPCSLAPSTKLSTIWSKGSPIL